VDSRIRRALPRIVATQGALLLSLSLFSAGMRAAGFWPYGLVAAVVLLVLAVGCFSWAFGYRVAVTLQERRANAIRAYEIRWGARR
jgi:hypothetical protein